MLFVYVHRKILSIIISGQGMDNNCRENVAMDRKELGRGSGRIRSDPRIRRMDGEIFVTVDIFRLFWTKGSY